MELGKKSEYDAHYNPNKLFAIARAEKRNEIGIDANDLPFVGYDVWNHYEVSWLNAKGKPIVAMAELIYDCASPFLIESKSLKLYFNSFNNTQYETLADVAHIIQHDLSLCLQTDVSVRLQELASLKISTVNVSFHGESLDQLDVACSEYTVNPDFLTVSDTVVNESLFSDLLKSNCLVTYQPDWGSVLIEYQGPKIDRAGLLQYLVSFRNHNEFHEQCIERIFMDIMRRCRPSELTVYGRYTRRGGLDINPYRSTKMSEAPNENARLIRQ